jgi:hypothetical protein
MGQRREPRKEVKLPVRIFGTDANGKTFSENVFTVNVSREGAKLTGLQAQVKANEIIGMVYGQSKGRFCVKWAGQPGTPFEGQIGLQNVAPEKSIWDFPLPAPGIDEYGRHSKGTERRKHPRLKCTNSVELHAQGEGAPIWGKAVELSLGGCFIEMPMPLKEGTKLKVGLWIKETKLWAMARVVGSRPGFGIGIRFTEISEEDLERLKQFLQSITRISM